LADTGYITDVGHVAGVSDVADVNHWAYIGVEGTLLMLCTWLMLARCSLHSVLSLLLLGTSPETETSREVQKMLGNLFRDLH
jgi:hypothetical protein